MIAEHVRFYDCCPDRGPVILASPVSAGQTTWSIERRPRLPDRLTIRETLMYSCEKRGGERESSRRAEIRRKGRKGTSHVLSRCLSRLEEEPGDYRPSSFS